MLTRVLEAAERLIRCLICLCAVTCGASVILLAAFVVVMLCFRSGEWLWANLLGFGWGGR